MKLYGSFLIRCWVIRDEREEKRTIFDIEHIQRGEHLRVNDLDEANQWMMQILESENPALAKSQSVEPEVEGYT
mgnify:CR=1 FL=1